MVVYSPVSPGAKTYNIPNVATAGFAIGSRIELFVDSLCTLDVGPDVGSGVTIYPSAGLTTQGSGAYAIGNVASNVQLAKLTMFATDKWVLSL
jgi:hypothetical protein